MPEARRAGQVTSIWVVSTVHQPDDVRIFWKEAVTLAASGYEVTAAFWTAEASAARDEEVAGVRRMVLWKGPRAKGPLSRLLVLLRTLRLCLGSGCRNVLIHDPELIPVGIILQAAGRRVIFDAHEELPLQALHKTYLAPWQKPLVQVIAKGLFLSADRWLSGRLYANAITQHRFRERSCLVRNFPLLREFSTSKPQRHARQIVYVGGLSAARGLLELIQAVTLIERPASLVLAGPWESEAFRFQCQKEDRKGRVTYAGTLGRRDIVRLLAESSVGVVVLHPVPAYLEALPVKLFEYMAAGLPVVVSDFPLWRGIVASANCGVLVPPCDKDALRVALDYLLEHPEVRGTMAANGRAAVERRYTWETESKRFVSFVESVFGIAKTAETAEPVALPS